MIKNNTLYIDGGMQTFQDALKNGTKAGNITVGYSKLFRPLSTEEQSK